MSLNLRTILPAIALLALSALVWLDSQDDEQQPAQMLEPVQQPIAGQAASATPPTQQTPNTGESPRQVAVKPPKATQPIWEEPESLDINAMTELEVAFLYDELDHCIAAISEEKAVFEQPHDRLTRLGYDTACLTMSAEELQALRERLLNSGKMDDLKKFFQIEKQKKELEQDVRDGKYSRENLEEAYQQLLVIMYQYLDILFYSNNPEAVWKAAKEFAWLRANMVYGGGNAIIHYSDDDLNHPMVTPFANEMMNHYAGDNSYNYKLYGLFRYCHLKQWHCQAKIKERYEYYPGFERQYGDLDGYTLFTQVVATPYVVQAMVHLQSITR